MDAREPLVSIITLTYNHARYIGACIESVLQQTHQNWEQIILDDGSTDRTAAIISEFKDARIHYYSQENKGIFRLAENYNWALARCRGSLIAPLEGDDLWPSDGLEVLVHAFADPAVVISYGICRGFTGNGTPVSWLPNAAVQKRYGKQVLFNDPLGAAPCAMLAGLGMVGSAAASVIRRSALDRIGGFQSVPGLPVVDYPTFLEIGLLGHFCFSDQITSYWRFHESNTTTLYRDAVARGLYRCALDFLQRHQHDRRLGSISRHQIETKWRKDQGRRDLYDGRMLLLEKRWDEARKHFRATLRSRRFELGAAALCGLGASYLRLNLEPVAQFGRKLRRADQES